MLQVLREINNVQRFYVELETSVKTQKVQKGGHTNWSKEVKQETNQVEQNVIR